MTQQLAYADLEIRSLERQDKFCPAETTVISEQDLPRRYLWPDFSPRIAEADLFVVIYAWRYDYLPETSEVSTTKLEFRGRETEQTLPLFHIR